MKPTWDEIVDYARGLATPEQSARIEGDKASLEIAKQFTLVAESGREQAPEMWVLRAKALLVAEARTLPLLFGRLVPASLNPAMGFRSGTASPLTKRYEFEGATLDLQIEPGKTPGTILIVGVMELPAPVQVRVGTEEDWLDACDEDGQFSLELPVSTKNLRFQDLATSQIFQISLDHEN